MCHGHPNKSVVFYAPYALWSPHYETDLELIKDHLEDGYDVTVLVCRAELPTCEPNRPHYREGCLKCISRSRKGIQWIGKDKITVKKFYNLTSRQIQTIEELLNRDYRDIEQLKAVDIGGADIGLAAVSSVVSHLRDPRLELQGNEKVIQRYLKTALVVYFSLLNHLSETKPDRLVIFNGRYAALRPALRVAGKLNIETMVHERAGVLGRYSITTNTYPQDLNYVIGEMEEVFRSSDLPLDEKEKISDSWYEERMAGVPQGWHSFITNQRPTELPVGFDKEKFNIAIFNSSEDEMVAIEEWKHDYYSSQTSAIASIVDSVSKNDNYKVYLRVHPNLSGVNNQQTEEINQLARAYPGLNIIGPNDSVSTYSLIRDVDLVVTFGSTVGIEAVRMKKPCMLMGRAIYEELGVCFQPGSYDECFEYINKVAEGGGVVGEKERRLAVTKYGFYQNNRGYPYKYVGQFQVEGGTLKKEGKEIVLRASIFVRAVFVIASYLRRVTGRRR